MAARSPPLRAGGATTHRRTQQGPPRADTAAKLDQGLREQPADNRAAAVPGGLYRHDAQAHQQRGPEPARSMIEQPHALAAILVRLDAREQLIEAQAASVSERLA